MEHSRFEQTARACFHSNAIKALRAVLTRSIRIDCDSIPFRFDHLPLSKILNWILVETSVYAGSLRVIWEGPRYHKMRRGFRSNYRNIEACRDCTYAFEGGSLGTEDILEACFIDAG